jgi:putative membrane protein
MSSEPRHLHPAAMLIDAIKTIRRWVSAFVIPGIAILASRGFSMQTIALIVLGALVAAVLAALWGFLSWRATTYEVSGGAFHLRQGVIQKNERTIPLEHVQSVDTVQGIIQRFFGVVEVRVETAGGGTSEPDASLPALDGADAAALRREIEGAGREPVERAAGPSVLRRLRLRELLMAGATSGQIGVAFSLIAVVSQLFDDLLSGSLTQRLFEALAPRSVTSALLLVGIFGVFAWLLAIAGTILAHAGFTLSHEGDFL